MWKNTPDVPSTPFLAMCPHASQRSELAHAGSMCCEICLGCTSVVQLLEIMCRVTCEPH